MVNARILDIGSMKIAEEEIRKIGTEADVIPWLSVKSMFLCIKIYNVKPFEANIIKQEMLSNGGDVVVNRGVFNCSVSDTDIIMMGTISQYNKTLYKLKMHSGLKEIADEVQKLVYNVEAGRQVYFKCCQHKIAIGEQTYVMGVLNITPDSFSDGGDYMDINKAINRAKEMVKDGAEIIDVGGESTRPGHTSVSHEEELNRIIPVVEQLVKEIEVPVSIDTSKAIVAEKALNAGAHIVNDVWGLQRDPHMADVIAKTGAGVIIMHNSDNKEYNDLMGDIIYYLRKSIDIAISKGIDEDSIIIDPGIGFGKTLEQNLEVMRRINELTTLGKPILLGTSRKSMIGNVLELPVNERLEGTAATVTLGIAGGVDIVRVHDVKEMSRVARMTDAMVRS